MHRWPAAIPFVERVIESMSNPYQSPQSAVMSSAQSASGAGAVIQLVVGLLCAVIAALLPMLVIPTFHEVFISFGAQLPQLTKVAVAYHLWLWLLPLLVVAARLFWPAARRRAKASCWIGVLGLVITVVVTTLAMYMPILRLDAVI